MRYLSDRSRQPDRTTPVHRRRWVILTVLGLSLFLVVVDNMNTNVGPPTPRRTAEKAS